MRRVWTGAKGATCFHSLCLVCVVFVFNGLLSGVVVMSLMLLGVGGVAKTNNNGIDEWMGVVCG